MPDIFPLYLSWWCSKHTHPSILDLCKPAVNPDLPLIATPFIAQPSPHIAEV